MIILYFFFFLHLAPSSLCYFMYMIFPGHFSLVLKWISFNTVDYNYRMKTKLEAWKTSTHKIVYAPELRTMNICTHNLVFVAKINIWWGECGFGEQHPIALLCAICNSTTRVKKNTHTHKRWRANFIRISGYLSNQTYVRLMEAQKKKKTTNEKPISYCNNNNKQKISDVITFM